MPEGKAPPRVTLLRASPVIGKYYLVPTVRYPWWGSIRAWPVFLPKHEDKAHLGFAEQHYHIDPRFVCARGWKSAGGSAWLQEHNRGEFGSFQRAPLSCRGQSFPPIVWKRLKCRRNDVSYMWSDRIAEKLTPHYIGKQCRSSKAGWICPHKRVPLGSFQPVDGIITCPLHGLQIDAETGKVMGPCIEAAQVAA